MDKLLRFIADISIDPPMYERGKSAAHAADISALSTFDYKKACTDKQREAIRLFLEHAGIEFDNDGWEELLTRPDAQQLLAGALWEGVRDAKKPAVTIAFCQVRQSIEHALTHPTFQVPETTPSVELPPSIAKERMLLNPLLVEEALNAETIDWSGIAETDRPFVRTAMARHISRMNEDHVLWMSKVRFDFVPHKPQQNEDLRYLIRESNGHISFFDGVFHGKNVWHIGPLPDELHGIVREEAS